MLNRSYNNSVLSLLGPEVCVRLKGVTTYTGLSELFTVGVCFDKVGGCREGTV